MTKYLIDFQKKMKHSHKQTPGSDVLLFHWSLNSLRLFISLYQYILVCLSFLVSLLFWVLGSFSSDNNRMKCRASWISWSVGISILFELEPRNEQVYQRYFSNPSHLLYSCYTLWSMFVQLLSPSLFIVSHHLASLLVLF